MVHILKYLTKLPILIRTGLGQPSSAKWSQNTGRLCSGGSGVAKKSYTNKHPASAMTGCLLLKQTKNEQKYHEN